VLGKIVAPSSIGAWGTCGDMWLSFNGIEGLTLDGTGSIDGQGSMLWGQKQCRPTVISKGYFPFEKILQQYEGKRTFINSPRAHIVILGSAGVSVSGIKITAPDESPNTDGIDISRSTNVQILDSVIGTGDDCVAINGGSSNITGKAVAVSDITFSNMKGTYSKEEPITLVCDSSKGCNNVRMEQIDLRTPSEPGEKGNVKCSNVKGERTSVTPAVPCLSATKA
ncbi:hypothetical protein Tsubulata_049978, partial [Turnera subulata]